MEKKAKGRQATVVISNKSEKWKMTMKLVRLDRGMAEVVGVAILDVDVVVVAVEDAAVEDVARAFNVMEVAGR